MPVIEVEGIIMRITTIQQVLIWYKTLGYEKKEAQNEAKKKKKKPQIYMETKKVMPVIDSRMIIWRLQMAFQLPLVVR